MYFSRLTQDSLIFIDKLSQVMKQGTSLQDYRQLSRTFGIICLYLSGKLSSPVADAFDVVHIGLRRVLSLSAVG